MSKGTLRKTKYLAGAALLVFVMGCGFTSELFNPEFFEMLGFDSQTIVSGPGRVVVAFQNSSEYVITNISAKYSNDRALTADVENLPLDEMDQVDAQGLVPNETRTLVLDCPVAVLSPQVVDAELDGSSTSVTYEGSPLVVDSDFQCGDVLEMELIQTGDEADSLALRIRVLPGR